MKPTPRQYKEAVERTEKIKEYLIKEGYADNPEMADSIIMGMSEQWYETILEDSWKILMILLSKQLLKF